MSDQLRAARDLVRTAATYCEGDTFDLALEVYVDAANTAARLSLGEVVAPTQSHLFEYETNEIALADVCYLTFGSVTIGDRIVANHAVKTRLNGAGEGVDVAGGDVLIVKDSGTPGDPQIVDTDGEVWLQYADGSSVNVWILPSDLACFTPDALRIGDRVSINGKSAVGFEVVDVNGTIHCVSGDAGDPWYHIRRDDVVDGRRIRGTVFKSRYLTRIV